MSNPSKDKVQRKPKHRDKLDGFKDGFNKFRARFSPASSTQPSGTSTPDPSAQPTSSSTRGEAGGARSLSKPEIIITPIDNGGDSSEASGVAAISKDTVDTQPKPDKDEKTVQGTTQTNPTDLWNIDGDAITQLRKWGTAHKNSNWLKLAEKIDQSLKSKTIDTLKDFIPDSPFPAKTLVKALLNLVELGISVPLVQKKVYDFAQEAIQYISSLVDIFGEEQSVKRDLDDICAAVNDICQWAKDRVSKISVSVDDLGDWESKFAGAKEKFMVTTVTKIRVEQAIFSRLTAIKEKLTNHTAAKYAHTDQSKSLCADGTRVELLKDIEKWLSPQSSNAERIFWVTGIPGSGKSTLSATIVDSLRKKRTPVSAQFFISRNIPETIDPDKIIPTIAQQLAISSPTAARILEKTLKDGYPAKREEQVTSLLLAPIRELSKSCDVVIILIDALDELKDAARSVMEILSHIAPIKCDLPDNVRFVITSRPEHWADISMSKNLELAVFRQQSLATESSVSEVHSFIVARMREIKPDEPDWQDWPHPDQLRRLSDKADGLFHYAATALQWIEGQIRKYKKACRSKVFDQFDQMGIGQLQDLYRLVLTSWENVDVPAVEPRRDQLDGFHHVIGTILVLQEPLLIRQIIALLSDVPEDKFDVDNFLQQMRSVLIPGTTTSFRNATPQIHKSFRDYIMSDLTPPEFRILTGDAHFKLARSCLDTIVKAGSQRDIGCEYAIEHWYTHLQKAAKEGASCDDERMWTLLGEMLNEGVVGVWTGKKLFGIFKSLATTGWQLLKQNTDKRKLVPISNMLAEIKAIDDRFFAEEFLRFFFDDTPYLSIWDDGLLAAWIIHQSKVSTQNADIQ
jgi:hypothetical protein